jgi:hypothetical protein
MKTIQKHLILFVLIALLALPVKALAVGPEEAAFSRQPDEFVLGDNYTLDRGRTLNGNLWVFGGNAELRQESRVTGNVMVFGGNLRVNGLIEGDINVAGGNVELSDSAVVRGDISMVGGSLSRDTNAIVEGDVREGITGPFTYTVPRISNAPRVNISINPIMEFLAFLFQAFLTAALAVLVVMFLPAQTQQVARTAVTQPLVSGGLGLMTVIVAPLLLLIMTITIILIPVAFLLVLLIGLLLLFGWIGVGLELGKRMATLLKTDWALPVAAGIGTLTLSIVIGGIGKYLWCIGWILPTMVALVGLGSVLLTRFGTQNYPLYGPPPVAPFIPTTPPPPPAPPRTPSGEDYSLGSGEPVGPQPGVGVYPLDEDLEEDRPE